MTSTTNRSKRKKIIIGTVIILLLSIGSIAYNEAVNRITVLHSSMANAISVLESKFFRAKTIEQIGKDLDQEMINGSAYVVEAVFGNAGNVKDALNTLKTDDIDYYFITEDNSIISSEGAPSLDLSEDQLKELKEKSTLIVGSGKNEAYYQCSAISNGHLISHYKKSLALEGNSALSGLSDRFGYYVAQIKDQKIIESTDERLNGQTVPDQLEPSLIKIDKNVQSKLEDYQHGFAKTNSGELYCIQIQSGDYTLGIYYPYTDFLLGLLGDVLPAFVVLLGVFLVIIWSLFKLMDHDPDPAEEPIKLPLIKKVHFDRTVLSTISGLIVFSFIIVLLFNIHSSEMSAYSFQSGLSRQNLELLSENMDACAKDQDNLSEIVKSYLSGIASVTADLIREKPAFASHDNLKELAQKCAISEVSLYGANGVLQVSSGDYAGQSIIKDESDPLFVMGKKLTSDVENVFSISDDGSNRYLYMQKRKDGPGFLCLIYQNDLLNSMNRFFSKEEAIKGTDFGNATTFYIKVSDEESTYVIKPYSKDVTTSNETLPDTLKQDNYSGISTIDGQESYVTTKQNGNLTVISAISCETINAALFENIWIVVVTFVLLMILILYGCSCPTVSEAEEDVIIESPDDVKLTEKINTLFADTVFRKMIKLILLVLAAGYVVHLFKPSFDGQTLLNFILYGKWDKGLNIFSVNASIIVGFATAALVILIKKLLFFIGKTTGTRGMTVVTIVASALQFLGIFYIIGYALYQFGVDTTALFAGAGIAGMVIGIGAKDIFNDLLSGLFLVFEGKIHVGDFVNYKDFRGEVVEIGARVSTIQRYNRKLVINNSELKQYYRLSDELGSAWVEIVIGADEDVYAVRDLINASQEWYQSMDYNLKEGPYFCNISHFDSSGITICLCGICTDERSGSSSRKLKLHTLDLFRRNGISLGMSTFAVTISDEEKKQYLEDARRQADSSEK